MLKERTPFFRKSLLAADLLLTVGSFMFALWALSDFEKLGIDPEHFSSGFLVTLLVGIVGLWAWLLLKHSQYGQFRGLRLDEIVWPVVRVIGVGTLILGFWLVFVELDRSGRATFLVSFAAINLVFLCGLRASIWIILVGLRSHGFNYQKVLVVGSGPRAKAFGESVHQHPGWGLRVVGYVDWDQALLGQQVNGNRVIGVLENFLSILDDMVIDEVVFFVPRRMVDQIDSCVRACEVRGIRTRIAVDLFSLDLASPELTTYLGVPMITYQTRSIGGKQFVVKRLIDIMVSSAGLVGCVPLFLVIAAAIKLTSPGPLLFQQTRVGLNGRQFQLLKFRSMVVDAEARHHEVAGLNELSGPMFKAKGDPRITPVGRWLRKWSLDELPQLVNVLRGDMSLVGPRPSLPHEIKQFQSWQKRRLSVRPGLTGLWQVSGRNQVDFEQWMKLDLEYIDRWSLGMDIKILSKTFPTVVTGKGAS
jgi:exopolysaccharide biosynthesis polyprenyl glycosylphosphotransferase